ncbi:hypothetical protein M422DRAFT_54917 [Sphaerobolus stellatus SS14]|uniref:GOLD domain-containing protein n=1 Tax=Sphaerobolus stellatus (strain SS14) TaxID=990650 RepID=A0A0C9U163_SPHS4|nr:hypothetical protein M422DRAFT_54917 [Sphaerobolus stellatus SS14]
MCFCADWEVSGAGECRTKCDRSQSVCDVHVEPSQPPWLKALYFSVQSCRLFDIDFEVKDLNNKVMLNRKIKCQGNYVFMANHAGGYSFCFDNDMSSLSGKLVDIDIMVESEPR